MSHPREWKPFLLAAREARLQDVPWALDPLDFRLVGQVVRAKRGPLWTYVWRTGVPTEELAREPVHRATHEGWDACEARQAWLDDVETPGARHLRVVR